MVAEIALDNSQYFWDWFKTYWMNIGVKVSNIFCTVTLIWGIGILLRETIISLEYLWTLRLFLVKPPRMWIQSWQKFSTFKSEDLQLCKPYWPFLSSLSIFLVQMVLFRKEDWIFSIETFFISLDTFKSLVAYRQHLDMTWPSQTT